jgi:uncharacterized integral membrane protein
MGRLRETVSMKNLKLYSFLILAVLAILIILQNTVEVQIRILFLTMNAPLALFLLITLLLGMVLGILIAYLIDHKARKRPA